MLSHSVIWNFKELQILGKQTKFEKILKLLLKESFKLYDSTFLASNFVGFSKFSFSKIESNCCRILLSTYIQNGTIAIGTTWTEEIVIIGFTVGESIALKEVACAQLLIAVIACEMLWMPGLAQSGNHLAHNWLLAGVAAALLYGVDSLTTHVCL